MHLGSHTPVNIFNLSLLFISRMPACCIVLLYDNSFRQPDKVSLDLQLFFFCFFFVCFFNFHVLLVYHS